MAALCTGNSYGLSNLKANDNKELIFVKLTDSAFRAIEEYSRNKDKLNSTASIKFFGNEGVLLFPTLANNDRKFNFSITEFEGSQGSFELIQQSTQNGRLLETLGAMPNKMLIQANDDVYEATKARMAVAEEIKKDKCTREIKPNQTDIWRRGKSKTSSSSGGSSLPNRLVGSNNGSSNNIPNSVGAASLTSAAAPYSSSINGHSSNGSSSSSNNNVNNLNSGNSGKQRDSYLSSSGSAAAVATNLNGVTSAVNGGGSSSLSLVGSGSSSVNNSLGSHGIANNIMMDSSSRLSSNGGGGLNAGSGTVPGGRLPGGNHRGNGYSSNSSSQNGGTGGSRGNSDICRRSIKERLIHLLAVRPYKKPELYAKLKLEGIKEKEKTQIANILKSISYLRDNTFHLNRHIWNDVQEDWPFYSEQDRACLKRRKPQNLTPPLSSDGGSSISGQSPKSTHSSLGGSPSQKRSMVGAAGDEKLDGPNAKKPRISHFVKATDTSPKISPRNHESEDSGMSLSFSVIRPESNGSSSSSSSSSCSGNGKRISPTFAGNGTSNSNGNNGSYKSSSHGNNKLSSSSSSNSHKESSNSNNNNNYRDNNGSNNGGNNGRSGTDYNNGHRNGSSSSSGHKKNGHRNNGEDTIGMAGGVGGGRGLEKDSEYGQHHNRYQLDINPKLNNGTPEHDFSEFTGIVSIDQRREYKSIFDKDYAEYRKLHEEIDRVSKRFAQLEENLRTEERSRKESSKVKEIQRQIMHEYKSTVQDIRHQKNKERFNYLHEKLSHIKRLVSDFDMTITKGNPMQAQTSY